MPILSKAQQAAMYSAAAGKSTLGIPQSVGKDFVAAGAAGGSFAKLPERKAKPKKKMGAKMQSAFKRGMMSKEAAEKRGYDTDAE
jgi:hypothetical protein